MQKGAQPLKFFEQTDFAYNRGITLKAVPFLDSYILFADDVFKTPDRVVEYLDCLKCIKSHKGGVGSRNGKNFLDGQHTVIAGHDRNRALLEFQIAGFFKVPYRPRIRLTFNQTRLLKPPPKNRYWWPHTDSYLNIVTYLNRGHSGKGGTTIYRQKAKQDPKLQEHAHIWRPGREFEELLCLTDRFNGLVAFPGEWFHGPTIEGEFFLNHTRYTEVNFL